MSWPDDILMPRHGIGRFNRRAFHAEKPFLYEASIRLSPNNVSALFTEAIIAADATILRHDNTMRLIFCCRHVTMTS